MEGLDLGVRQDEAGDETTLLAELGAVTY